MIACQVAHSVFHTPTRIGRIRGHDFLSEKKRLFSEKAIPINVLISPEQLVTRHVKRLIEHPGALQVLDLRRRQGPVGGGQGLLRWPVGGS